MKNQRIEKVLVFLPGASIPNDIKPGDRIICADSGAIPVLDRGLRPDMIIGDMDSIPGTYLKRSKDMGVCLRTYPSDKDTSDGELALREAVALSPLSIVIHGGKNGRSDHMLSNFQMLFLVPSSIDTYLDLNGDRVYLVRDREIRTFKKDVWAVVSILPSWETARVDVQGMKYDLEGRILGFGTTLGIHNEPVLDEIKVRSIDGPFFVVFSMDER